MFSPINRLPKSWKTDAKVLRSGGNDNRGNPLPSTEIPRTGVLIGPRATSDPVDRSDVTAGLAVLYDGDTSFIYHTSDVIVVPAGARMAGRWKVAGRPGQWPYGTEVGLTPA